MATIDKTISWKNLEQHQQATATVTLAEMFKSDPSRATKYTISTCGLHLDFSKNFISDKTLKLLFELAKVAHLPDQISALFAGKRVNISENKPALHTALRDSTKLELLVDGIDIKPLIEGGLTRIEIFSEKIRKGAILGPTGKKIKTVINIGIGGSEIGPKMVNCALRCHKNNSPDIKFLSNVDFDSLLCELDAVDIESTVFIVSSKSFETTETLEIARFIQKWGNNEFSRMGIDKRKLPQCFYAITANKKRASQLNIPTKNIFEIWDWVGGRYSVWSSMGLSIALSLGYKKFRDFLEGAYSMDKHFISEDWRKNLPVIMSLITVWNRNFRKFPSQAVLPYSDMLAFLPAYLQQLTMESNGKSINRAGNQINYETAPIVWGDRGTNFQHAFSQHLHQSSTITPCDFIVAANPNRLNDTELADDARKIHNTMLANCFAQSKALMEGRNLDSTRSQLEKKGVAPHQLEHTVPQHVFPGNRPSNTIIMDKIDPRTLGSLIALYEHKTFCEGIIWNINSFDQWGVEFGKILARDITSDLSKHSSATDPDLLRDGLTENIKKILK